MIRAVCVRDDQQPTLPNLFIVGAAKAGTTSLHALLGRHPAAFMSEPKEPRFFAYEGERPEAFGGPGASVLVSGIVKTRRRIRAAVRRRHRRTGGRRELARLPLQPGGCRLGSARRFPTRGSSCSFGTRPTAPTRTGSTTSAADGSRSTTSLGSLDLAEERRRQNWWRKWDYIGHGFYAAQLKRYLDRFPRRSDQGPAVRGHARRAARRRRRSVRVPRPRPSASGAAGACRGRIPVVCRDRAPSRPYCRERNPIRSSLRLVLPSGIRARARRSPGPAQHDETGAGPDTRARLQELYRDDVCELESLIDRDLSHWLRPSN